MLTYWKKKYNEFNFQKNIWLPWENPIFRELEKKTKARLSSKRNYMLKQFLLTAVKEEGCIAEFGVYKGSSAHFIAELIQGYNRKLFLFDTFTGTPKQSSFDEVERTVFYEDVNFKKVKKRFEKYDFVSFYPGLLPVSIPQKMDKKIIFAHIHLNLYQSTTDTLNAIEQHLSENAIVMIEDYGIKQCAGVKKAVDDYVKKTNKKFVYLPTCQGVIW